MSVVAQIAYIIGAIFFALWVYGSINTVVRAQRRQAAAARLDMTEELRRSPFWGHLNDEVIAKATREDMETLYGRDYATREARR